MCIFRSKVIFLRCFVEVVFNWSERGLLFLVCFRICMKSCIVRFCFFSVFSDFVLKEVCNFFLFLFKLFILLVRLVVLWELFVMLGFSLEGVDLGVWKELFLIVLSLYGLFIEGLVCNVMLFLGVWYIVGDLLLWVFGGGNGVKDDLMGII